MILLLRFHFLPDDWTSERRSYRYTLSDVINMQASVVGGRHPPYRVLVDDCVAVASADSSGRRRDFIKNHGYVLDVGSCAFGVLMRLRPQVSGGPRWPQIEVPGPVPA